MGRRLQDPNTSPCSRQCHVPCDLLVILAYPVIILPVPVQCIMIVVTVVLPCVKLYRLTDTYDYGVNSYIKEPHMKVYSLIHISSHRLKYIPRE